MYRFPTSVISSPFMGSSDRCIYAVAEIFCVISSKHMHYTAAAAKHSHDYQTCRGGSTNVVNGEVVWWMAGC